jgi:type I restriction enzyme S subunit
VSDTALPNGWALTSIGDIHTDVSQTINPAKNPDQLFELWSVPSFASSEPEIIKGSEIGSNKQSTASIHG